MGNHVLRQTPKAMPSANMVATIMQGLPKPVTVVGSRGTSAQQNRTPNFETHSVYRFATGSLQRLQGKHVYLFIHGYNLTAEGGLRDARAFFDKLHTALVNDGQDTANAEYVLFTWPGDTGTVYFDDAQQYAHHSGVALFHLLEDCQSEPTPKISLVAHSLGSHVALRGLSVLGERLFHQKASLRVVHTLLLGPSVEDDVFSRPSRQEEYHFPESAFAMEALHMVIARSDIVLSSAFYVNEQDRALGFAGPETMDTLVSLARRVQVVLGAAATFTFELHDFSSRSASIMDPALYVYGHGEYWKSAKQLEYYVNLIKIT